MKTKPATPPRLPFLVLALLLSLLAAALGGTSFQRRIAAFQPLGFEAVADQGGWRVEGVDEGVGLAVGDEVLLVRGETVASRAQLGERLRAQPKAPLLVKRGDALVDLTYVRPPLEVDVAYLILAAVGVVYLLIGLYTAFKDGRSPARLFFFWCLSSALLYVLSTVYPIVDDTGKVIDFVDQVARTLLPALTLHLFLVFPAPLPPAKRGAGRFLAAAVYLPAALLLAFHTDQALAGGALLGRASDAVHALISRLELYLLIFFSLLAVLVLFVRWARHPEWEERRQVQWIALGLLAGYVPFFAIYVAPLSVGFTSAWTRAAGVVPLALVPLGFAYAILKYKLWDIALVVRDTIAYSATVLIGLCGFALIHLMIERVVSDETAMVRNFLTFAAGLVVAGALVPAKSFIATGLERWQYRQTLPQRRALGRLGAEILYERDLSRLCITLIDRLANGLAAHANLYLMRGSGRLSPVIPEAGLPTELAADALGETLWERDVESLEPVGLPGTARSVAGSLFEAGYRYAFPLLVRDHRVGVLVVSYKFDGEPLNSEDLELTRGLLNQASLAIENAHLLEEVHRRLKEVGRLEEHNKGIIESSPVGIAVLDTGGQVVSVNAALAALVGRPAAELVGGPFEAVLPVRPLPLLGEGLVEVSYGELSGRERYLQLATAPYESHEGEPFEIVIVQDTSELHAIQLQLKEKERLASLGLLAAGVAHEVNTPLTGISSYAQLLLSDVGEGHPHYEILKKLERQTFRAAQIVNNLLEFSRNRHDELLPVNLAAVVDESLRLLAERFGEAKVEIEWQRPPREASNLVLGHEGELHQVFTNLMVNAVDAMEGAAERRLTITIEADDEHVTTRLSDSGHGIAPERLERIFQPFYSSKLGKGGTGLGLAISHNIVGRHRGEIRAENRSDGRGSTFVVVLPRHRLH